MSNFSSVYLDDDHDGEINNVDTVNSVPCAGDYAKHFMCLITFNLDKTLRDGNRCFILQIRKLRFRKAT